MSLSLFDMLSYFIIYSFLGWIMESIFRSFCEKKIINTGFLIRSSLPDIWDWKYNNDTNNWTLKR